MVKKNDYEVIHEKNYSEKRQEIPTLLDDKATASYTHLHTFIHLILLTVSAQHLAAHKGLSGLCND